MSRTARASLTGEIEDERGGESLKHKQKITTLVCTNVRWLIPGAD